MSRFTFEFASLADDRALRDVLARTPMDGDISISFQREPSYFEAAVVGGDCVQTVIGRDSETGKIVGLGVRSIREMHVNGRPRPIGYLSGLRLLPDYRSIGLLARGYRFFSQLHADQQTSLYLTTIARGNDPAINLLTSARAGIPPYHPAGTYWTLVIPAPRKNKEAPPGPPGLVIRPATDSDVTAIVEFLNHTGPQRQFFPCYKREDLFRERCTFRDLRPADILLAERDQQIVGTLGVWQQTRFRQSVVCRYSRRLQWTRPAYNAWAHLTGAPSLPRVGEPLSFAMAALFVVAGDDLAVARALVETARRRLQIRSGHLLLGLHERDPLLPAVRGLAVTNYQTLLYQVCWPDGDALRESLDDRAPYLELGTL